MKRCLTKIESLKTFCIPGQLGGNGHAGGVCHTDTGAGLGQHEHLLHWQRLYRQDQDTKLISFS